MFRQHRGMQSMSAPSGNTRYLTCPYHGWAYDMEGTLEFVPDVAGFCARQPLRQAQSHRGAVRGLGWLCLVDNLDRTGPFADFSRFDCRPDRFLSRWKRWCGPTGSRSRAISTGSWFRITSANPITCRLCTRVRNSRHRIWLSSIGSPIIIPKAIAGCSCRAAGQPKRSRAARMKQ